MLISRYLYSVSWRWIRGEFFGEEIMDRSGAPQRTSFSVKLDEFKAHQSVGLNQPRALGNAETALE